MPSVSRIVVGVDGSAAATGALDWAAEEATSAGAVLTVVAAWTYGGHLDSVPSPADRAHVVVEEARARMAASFPTVVARYEVHEGTPAYVLIDAARDADLLVVGSRGLGGFRGLLVGSVGQHCLTHAPCSVAVVRPSPTPAPSGLEPWARRIVVGVDGSPGARRALEWSVDQARRSGAEIEVVASWVFPGTAGYVFSIDPRILDDARNVAREAVAQAESMAESVEVRSEVSEDPAPVALVEASRKADLVVVGSRGLHGFRGLHLGSVSRHVALHAHCPVVVVRERPDQ